MHVAVVYIASEAADFGASHVLWDSDKSACMNSLQGSVLWLAPEVLIMEYHTFASYEGYVRNTVLVCMHIYMQKKKKKKKKKKSTCN